MNRREVIKSAAALGAFAALPLSASAAKPRALIMPDIRLAHTARKFAEENCWTTVYTHMMRIDRDPKTISTARTDSDTYRRWLAEFPPANGIPPHIAFSGAVVAGSGDPAFKRRWEQRTLAAIREGRL